MRFEHTEEQRDFARSVDQLLTSADTVAAARAWADGDHAPGLEVWRKLADQGVNALLVPEEAGGLGASATELVIALEAVGRHVVPGPWVESVAYLSAALADAGGADDLLAALAGGGVATVAAPPHTPYALDADAAEHVLLADTDGLRTATVDEELTSLDRTRRLHRVAADGTAPVTTGPPSGRAFDLAALATAAQLLGAGERLLADSVAYVQQRRQFGRRSGPTRRSSTTSPTCGSRSTSPAPWSTARPSRETTRGAETSRRPRSPAATRPTWPPGPRCRCTERSDTPPSSTCRCGCSRCAP